MDKIDRLAVLIISFRLQFHRRNDHGLFDLIDKIRILSILNRTFMCGCLDLVHLHLVCVERLAVQDEVVGFGVLDTFSGFVKESILLFRRFLLLLIFN